MRETKRDLRNRISQLEVDLSVTTEALYKVMDGNARNCVSPECGLRCVFAQEIKRKACDGRRWYTGVAYVCAKDAVCEYYKPISEIQSAQ